MSRLVGVTVGAAGVNTVARPAGVQAGDFLLVSALSDDAFTSIAPPAGVWAPVKDDPFTTFLLPSFDEVSVGRQALYWRLAGDAEPATYTVGATLGSRGSMIVAAWRGLSPEAPWVSGGVDDAPEISSAGAGTGLVGVFVRFQGGSPTAAAPSGWTEVADINQTPVGAFGHILVERYPATAGTVAAAMTWSGGSGDIDVSGGTLYEFDAIPRWYGTVAGRFLSAPVRLRSASGGAGRFRHI